MHHAHIDKLAYGDSPVHRLDARMKFIAVAIFTVLVISLPITSVGVLMVYAVGPFIFLVAGGIPLKFVFRHILTVCPFVLVLALSSPLYDRTAIEVTFGPFSGQITEGWLRFWSIMARFIVTMMALIGLVSTTKFTDMLAGLERMKVPKVLITVLGFVYRYIFLLIDRVHHMLRARASRKLRYLGVASELKVVGAMVGSLFIRSIEKAEQVNIAMQARGFAGSWRTIGSSRIGRRDIIFIAVVVIFIIGVHFIIRPILF